MIVMYLTIFAYNLMLKQVYLWTLSLRSPEREKKRKNTTEPRTRCASKYIRTYAAIALLIPFNIFVTEYPSPPDFPQFNLADHCETTRDKCSFERKREREWERVREKDKHGIRSTPDIVNKIRIEKRLARHGACDVARFSGRVYATTRAGLLTNKLRESSNELQLSSLCDIYRRWSMYKLCYDYILEEK